MGNTTAFPLAIESVLLFIVSVCASGLAGKVIEFAPEIVSVLLEILNDCVEEVGSTIEFPLEILNVLLDKLNVCASGLVVTGWLLTLVILP